MTAERCKIREASLITGLDIRTLQEKAASGEIPSAEKPFGRWTFDIAKLRQMKGRQCAVSTRGTGFTGRVSRFADTNTAQAYERARSSPHNEGICAVTGRVEMEGVVRAFAEVAYVAGELHAVREAGFTGQALHYPRSHDGLVALCAFNGIRPEQAPRGWRYWPNVQMKNAWERVISSLTTRGEG